ncbi:MAG: protein-L-isoaspartate O-methyltransferase [Beijerinckiaceae bacterium]
MSEGGATGQGGAGQSGDRPLAASAAGEARMAFILQLRERGVADVNVLRALETVPREKFVPRRYADLAWRDIALPIACGQVMPDPFVVARTMEALELGPGVRVLEIGAGSGYATAILSRLAKEVVSFERYRSLAVEAQERLAAIGADNVKILWADGFAAAATQGRFDRILVHLSLGNEAEVLASQLAPGGRMVVGRPASSTQPPGLVVRYDRGDTGFVESFIVPVRLTPALEGLSRHL